VDTDCGFEARLDAARAGEEWALTALYRSLHAKLVRYLKAHDPDAADDIASDVWLDIAAGLDRFAGDESDFRAWSFTIARRRLVDSRRRDAREERRRVALGAVSERFDDDDLVDRAAADIAIESALRQIAALPHKDAEVILLRVVGGFTAEEVGAIIHRPTVTVRSHQQRAIQRLVRDSKAEAA
jgi:RNA polymerase sigma-70 factor (ECF subfamily)